MIIPISQLRDLISAGASLVLDTSTLTLNDMKMLAGEALKARVQITFKKVEHMTQENLKQVASIAPGFIMFDMTDREAVSQ